MQIGTRVLGRPMSGADPEATGPGAPPGHAPEPGVKPLAGAPGGADGTLLAVVPIPGTGTSLAIVGYPVTTGASPAGLIPAGSPATAGQDVAGGQPGTGGEAGDAADGLRLDHEQRRVWVDGDEVPLTFQEFELLAFLAGHPVTVFSRADLVRAVWQRDFAADSRTVDVHVSRLRAKLGHYGKCLVTEYRVGYQFRPR